MAGGVGSTAWGEGASARGVSSAVGAGLALETASGVAGRGATENAGCRQTCRAQRMYTKMPSAAAIRKMTIRMTGGRRFFRRRRRPAFAQAQLLGSNRPSGASIYVRAGSSCERLPGGGVLLGHIARGSAYRPCVFAIKNHRSFFMLLRQVRQSGKAVLARSVPGAPREAPARPLVSRCATQAFCCRLCPPYRQFSGKIDDFRGRQRMARRVADLFSWPFCSVRRAIPSARRGIAVALFG